MCENFHWQLSVHLVGGRVYWVLFQDRRNRPKAVLARGVIEEPMAALYHSPATHLMEAAYEAYRSIGD
jgi:hypothetical protein